MYPLYLSPRRSLYADTYEESAHLGFHSPCTENKINPRRMMMIPHNINDGVVVVVVGLQCCMLLWMIRNCILEITSEYTGRTAVLFSLKAHLNEACGYHISQVSTSVDPLYIPGEHLKLRRVRNKQCPSLWFIQSIAKHDQFLASKRWIRHVSELMLVMKYQAKQSAWVEIRLSTLTHSSVTDTTLHSQTSLTSKNGNSFINQ